MIVHVNGILDEKTPGYVVIEAGGIGYGLAIPLSTYDRLPRKGEKVKLLAYHSVREDDELLFGFATGEELEMFKLLVSVNGVGPRLALALLSGMGVGDLQFSIVHAEAKRLASIKGIGKKTAERLCVELKDRINLIEALSKGLSSQAGGDRSGMIRDALLALVALGFSEDAARKQIDSALAANPSVADTQALIRLALGGR